MPIIEFHGKKAIINYEPPFHLLEEIPELGYQSPIEGNSQDNILIEGDNLLALKSLLPEYEGKIKCIYIDPPYNTNNKDWVYCDNIEITSKNDPAWKQVEKFLKDGNEVDYNDQSRHSKWLCMMYPRLKLLHKLLKDDGVIFVSIDDNEVHHLRMIMDEIWGEQNFIQEIVWQKKSSGGQHSTRFLDFHEYILCYAKDNLRIESLTIERNEKQKKSFKLTDEYESTRGKYLLSPLKSWLEYRKTLIYQIKCPDGTLIETQWVCAEDTYFKLLEEDRIVFKQNKNKEWSISKKQYANDREGMTKPPSILTEIAQTSHGKTELKKIFNEQYFDFPKPTNLIKFLLSIISDPNSIILDSFAGSGTTAHSVLDLNKQDRGNRKFITIQLPEAIKEDKPAYQAGYKFVHQITRERIKRVAGGYTNSNGEEVEGLGGGFKYYRIGTPLFTKKGGDIVSTVTWSQLAPYLYFTEFRVALEKAPIVDEVTVSPLFVGKKDNLELYLVYSSPEINVLTEEIIKNILKNTDLKTKKIIYADNLELGLDEEYLEEKNIIFRQIPYDIFMI